MKHFSLLVVLFLITGCTSLVPLEKRVSFDAEQDARQIQSTSSSIIVKGSQENNQLKVFVKPDSVTGSAVTTDLDVGLTFNAMIKQLATYSGFDCSINCNEIIVILKDPKVKYSYNLLKASGFDYGGFECTVQYHIPSRPAPIIKHYEYTKEYAIDELDGNNRIFAPVLISIEKVVIQVLKDIDYNLRHIKGAGLRL
ncbi:hypothetical protein MSL71_45510 [Desulfoluna butyratoxydans]|uniref:Lipoprotein n=1 Tax=Desulfoluna butyratoxydans TaxID=231438 RepID=A0A4U8YU10_9BACT|nr:hypothetical protein MSL71_45510 [Desulfoluna butyratoxydans]